MQHYGKNLLIMAWAILMCTNLACGTKSKSSVQDSEEESSERGGNKNDPLQSFQVTELSGLPPCKGDREGAIAFVKSAKQFRVCENGEWQALDLDMMTQATASGGCSITKLGEISSIVCGSSSVQIQDGIAANGTACSVTKVGAVATLTCGQSSVTISDGAQGSPGIAGPVGATGATGAPGAIGTQGAAGTSCSVSKSGALATIICGSQSVQVLDGVAGVGCSVSKSGGTATVVCGSQSVTLSDGLAGPQGAQGLPGANGFNALVDFANEPSGSNCIGGGTKFIAGLDNGDGSGIANNNQLEAGEVDSVKYLCRDPNSFAVAGQKLASNGSIIGTIEKRFQTWKHDYNTYFLIPSDEIFLLSNLNQTAKTLHRATRINSTACSGRVGDNYSVYDTCTDFDAALQGFGEVSGYAKYYGTPNCTGTPVIGRSGSYYANNNPMNFDQSAFLDFVASLGPNIYFRNGTSWTKLNNTTPSSMYVLSAGSAASCVLLCKTSDYCSSNGSNNGVSISGFNFTTASEADVGLQITIPAGWKTY